MPGPIIELRDVTKEFARDQFRTVALHGVSQEVQPGEFVALMGPSGSGKSTLLHLIAALDRPTTGTVLVGGQDITTMKERQLARWRHETIGFVFQEFNLIPVLTAVDNVELPLRLTTLTRQARRTRATTALHLVGLDDRLHHYPNQLSGGQEQRVAIARAIVTDPLLILADEPTGNLDSQAAADVLAILARLNREHGKTIVMVTHDVHAATIASRVCHLEKGELKSSSSHALHG